MASNIEIKNKKAAHEYFLTETYTAGIQLRGTEIKAIRSGKASLSEAYCNFDDGELWLHMHISEYDFGGYVNHLPRRPRKLLLNRRELKKLETKSAVKGFTIVPIMIFFSEKGLAKVEISLAEGKRKYDKRQSLKEKENKRELDRVMKR